MKICARAIALTLVLGILSSCVKEKRPLKEAEAIHIAEQFVAENGYTDLLPNQDRTQLSSESLDSAEIDQRLRQRYNTLERKAYAVGNGDVREYGWTIVFRYNQKSEDEEPIKEVGRAVTMDADGRNIKMQHQDTFLNGLKVIKN
jgi:leucyl aminopeptidase